MNRHDALDDAARDQLALAAVGGLTPEEAALFEQHLGACALCLAEYAALREVAADLSLIVAEEPPPESLWRRLDAAMHAAPHDPPPAPPPAGARTTSRAFAPPAAGAPGSVPAPIGRLNGTPHPHAEGTERRDGAEASPRDADTQTWKRWSDDTSPGRAPHFTFVPADEHLWEPTAVAGIEARRLFVDAARDRVTMLVRMAPGSSYPAHRHANAEECFVLQGDLRAGDVHLHEGDYQRADVGSEHPVQITDHGCVLLLVSSLCDELLPG